MALYTEIVTIVSCSIEGGNPMAGMPHPIIAGVPSPEKAYVTIRSADNSRRTFEVLQSTASKYLPGGTLQLSIDVAPLI